MNFNLIRKSFLGFFILFASSVCAQEVYTSEIGVHAGGAYYLGDANGTMFKNNHLSYGALYRYKFNARFAAHIDATRTKISGGTTEFSAQSVSFENDVNTLDLCFEFNFFNLERKSYMPFSKTFTPYIFAGVGAMNYEYENGQEFKFSYPFGLGFKMMLGERFNFNATWKHKLLLSDQMEGVRALNDSRKINGSNILNGDLLSTFTIGLTVNIAKKECNCNSFY